MTILRLGGLALLACHLVAAEHEPPAPAWTFAGLVTDNHMGSTDFRDTSGSLAVNEVLYEARAFWHPRPGTMLAFGLGGGYWHYDSERLQDDYGIEGTIRGHRLRAGGMQMFSPHWGMILQEAVGIGYDGHTALRNGLQSWTYAGPVWVRDRDLFVSVGAYTTTRLTGGVTIIPVPTVHWRIDPTWTLTVFDQIDTYSRLTCRLNEQWSLGLRLDVQQYQSALAHDTATQASVLEDKHTVIGVESDWSPWGKGPVVRPFVGVALKRQIILSDDNGDQLFNERTKTTPVLGLSLYAEF